jgi:hypothetical protein
MDGLAVRGRWASAMCGNCVVDDTEAFLKAGWSDSGGGVGAKVCDLGRNTGCVLSS